MTWNHNNWTVYAATLFITIAVLVAGQLVWNNYGIAKPLNKSMQDIPGVEGATWNEAGKNSDGITITVTLGQVADLQKTYNQIMSTSKKILGRRSFSVILDDHRTPELESLYYDIHYYVQEAITTGNFAAMADSIKAHARTAQVEARVYVDAKYVYVELTKGQTALYSVIPRQSSSQEVK
ncbi:MAG: hypothetical protein H6Q73_636 [Firmicutes bacterium]|nr:hypothetical protein [Bacillota bacterium]